MPRVLPRRRRGATLIEVVLAVTLLTLGMFPIFDALRSARGRLGLTRTEVRLQGLALQLLREGQSLVRMGSMDGPPPEGGWVLQEVRDSVILNLHISPLEGGRLYLLRVRAEQEGRFFEASQLAAAALTCFQRPGSEEGGDR